jgi:GNAT superfamily N-acetyltransferase
VTITVREATPDDLDSMVLLLGTADLWIAPDLLRGGVPRAFVNNVAVLASARRSGVGRASMEDAHRRAAHAGCGDVLLMSGDHRSDAHRSYGASATSAAP